MALKIAAQDLMGLGIIDEIVPEPLGGAHRKEKAVCDRVAKALTNQLFQHLDLPDNELIDERDLKLRKIGAVDGTLLFHHKLITVGH